MYSFYHLGLGFEAAGLVAREVTFVAQDEDDAAGHCFMFLQFSVPLGHQVNVVL